MQKFRPELENGLSHLRQIFPKDRLVRKTASVCGLGRKSHTASRCRRNRKSKCSWIWTIAYSNRAGFQAAANTEVTQRLSGSIGSLSGTRPSTGQWINE